MITCSAPPLIFCCFVTRQPETVRQPASSALPCRPSLFLRSFQPCRAHPGHADGHPASPQTLSQAPPYHEVHLLCEVVGLSSRKRIAEFFRLGSANRKHYWSLTEEAAFSVRSGSLPDSESSSSLRRLIVYGSAKGDDDDGSLFAARICMYSSADHNSRCPNAGRSVAIILHTSSPLRHAGSHARLPFPRCPAAALTHVKRKDGKIQGPLACTNDQKSC